MSESNEEQAVPDIPLQVLKGLFEAACAFRDLTPWKWMTEDHTFGLVDPATGVLHVAVVLGAEEGPPGFGLYRGERGYRYLYRTHDDPGTPLNPDVAMDEDSLLVEFVARKELQPHDLFFHDLAEFKPAASQKGKRVAGLPRFSSRLPCHVPWLPDAPECELLTTALVLAQGFSSLLEENPDFYGKRPFEDIPVYSRVGDRPDSPWKLEWRTLDLSPPPGPPPAKLPPNIAEQLLQIHQAEGAEWELETYHPPTLVRKPNRPFYPRAALMAEVETGRFLDIELSHPDEPEGDHVARSLADTIREVGHRPAVIYTNSPTILEALWPLAERLGIRLRMRTLLKRIPPIKEFLEQRFQKELEEGVAEEQP